jgi:sigma-B regulation protein RsbU (phosphoserine phosphatase)
VEDEMAGTRLLGEILVEHGIISSSQLKEAVACQKDDADAEEEAFSLMELIERAKADESEADFCPLGEILIKKGFAGASEVQHALQIQQEQFDLTKHLNADQLRTLLGVSSALNSTINLVELLTLIMESANEVVDAEASSLMILDERTQELAFSVPTGPKKDEMKEIRIATDKGIAGWVFTHNQPLLIPDVTKDSRFFHGFDKSFDFETRSIICVPLLLKGKVKGVLEVLNKKDGSAFGESDLYLLKTFANQAGIALENARLRQESLEKQRLRHELAVANEIQTALLPARTPKMPGLELAALLKPAAEVSGDFFDFIELNGKQLAIVMGDISGKGVPAGLLMAASRSSLRTRIESVPSVSEAIYEVNRVLLRDAEGRFVTLFLSLVDVEKRTFSYSNCGHMPGLLFKKNAKKLQELTVGGSILGAFEDFGYQEETLNMETGDTILLYTDGVTDEENPDGEKFELERLYRVFEENAHLDAGEVIRSIERAVSAFMEGGTQADDLTILALKFT